jgi:hypothetical protein
LKWMVMAGNIKRFPTSVQLPKVPKHSQSQVSKENRYEISVRNSDQKFADSVKTDER